MDFIADDDEWATDQFSHGQFGDPRRVARATSMLRSALARPSGKLTETFRTSAHRQGAYDFVEGPVEPELLMESIASATARQLGELASIFVPVDGTSLSLTDRQRTKGFGAIGKRAFPTLGLKVIDAVAVTRAGVPVGLLDLRFWARAPKATMSRAKRRKRGVMETQHWLDTVEMVAARLCEHAPNCTPCFVIDREGDASSVLRAVSAPGRRFIVRASQDRRIAHKAGRRRMLKAHMKRQPVIGTRVVNVPAGPNRRARIAVLDLRRARVVLDLPDYEIGRRSELEVDVVWATEHRKPRGEERLDWMLLTNEPCADIADVHRVLDGYCLRWRIEDFHRSWKSGRCNVEDTQLRSRDAVIRWATILAAVATRIEQLKHFARTTPDAPASVALSAIEIEALIAAKRLMKSRVETISDTMPTIAQAVRWIADLGGYTGKSSGGLPGSITIGRGLEWLAPWTLGFASGRKSRRR